MKKSERDFNLLPNYFKKIGVALFVLSIGLFFLLKAFSVEKVVVVGLSYDGIILSFLVIAFSKEKTEDELLQRIRLRAFSGAFIAGAVFFLVNSVMTLAFGFGAPLSTRMLLLELFVFYFLFFFLAKRKR